MRVGGGVVRVKAPAAPRAPNPLAKLELLDSLFTVSRSLHSPTHAAAPTALVSNISKMQSLDALFGAASRSSHQFMPQNSNKSNGTQCETEPAVDALKLELASAQADLANVTSKALITTVAREHMQQCKALEENTEVARAQTVCLLASCVPTL